MAEKESKPGIFGIILKSIKIPTYSLMKRFCLIYIYANVHIQDSDDWAEKNLLCKNKGRKTMHNQQLFLKAFPDLYWRELRKFMFERKSCILD